MPAFPSHLLSVAAWRLRLRAAIYDKPITVELALGQSPPDASLLTVLTDSDLDEALREALSALSVWAPARRTLPPLTLVPGQNVYPLPADFAEPVEETWGSLLGPDPIRSGRIAGSRYALLRTASLQNGPAPDSSQGCGRGYSGYGSYWLAASFNGSLFDGSLPILPDDASGNPIIDSFASYLSPFAAPRAAFFPASFDAPTPALVLSPPPTGAATLMNLGYLAAHLPRRLTIDLASDPSGNTWLTDTSGNLVFTLAPMGSEFVDATDVLPFADSDDRIRLSLRYAAHWALTQKIIALSENDEEKWAFYSVKNGMGRSDIQRVADRALAEFKERTSRVPHGGRY